jgi:hypothetical protein
VPQALAARYGLTAGTERKCSRGLWTKLSLDVTKSGQEPTFTENNLRLGRPSHSAAMPAGQTWPQQLLVANSLPWGWHAAA